MDSNKIYLGASTTSGSGDHQNQSQSRFVGNGTTSSKIAESQCSSSEAPSNRQTNGSLLHKSKEAAGLTTKSSPASLENKESSNVILLLMIFAASVMALGYVYFMFPQLDEAEKEHVRFPFNIEDAKNLAKVLDRYKDLYYIEVMAGIILAYVFLQAFAIPGSLFLSILSGFLFHFAVALPLVCFCSAFGATLCYLLSQIAGRRLVKKFFPERSEKWSRQIEEHKENLFNYMLFLRMTPILPNWFINLVAPVIGVPLAPFAFGTFFGVAPPSIIAIQAGKTLHTMTSSSEAFSWRSMLILAVLAVLSIVPSLFKKKLKAKLA